jgi:fluoroquinolone transport system permease protein
MDPATIGLSFVGAMVLVEKSQGTLFALGVTPARPAAYVAAKAVSLTLLTFASSLAVLACATGGKLDLGRQLLALALCSAVAVLIGLLCVARVASMNQLITTLLWVQTLLYVPLLSHFEVVAGALKPVVALIPSYAMLVALEASIDPESLPPASQALAALYLLVWTWFGWRQVRREFTESIVTEGR